MRRRPRSGSIFRERGRIVLRITVDGPDGPVRTRNGSCPDTPEGWEHADRERRILVGAEAAGGLQAPTHLTVGDYLESWIEALDYDVRMGSLRPGTAHHYAIDMRAKVIPRIGQVALTDVTSKMLRRLYSDLLVSCSRTRKPLSGKSVRNVGTILRRALRDAVADDLLKSNPADGVKLPEVIALDPATVETLKAHRVAQLEQRLAAGELWADCHGLVFTYEIGDCYSPGRYSRLFQSEASRLGLPQIGVHDLRHSLATTALAEGVPAKVVADRLGHASVAATLDGYSHVSEEQDRAAAVALATGIAGA
jgi:site-specific recombinase XerC